MFIQVGGWIGLWPTLLIVVVTAMIGTFLVREQGRQALDQLRQSFSELRDPAEPLANGAMILVAGALLLTPGFFTDSVGFLLLVPAFRRLALLWLRKRVNVQTFSMGDRPEGGPNVIDGEFTEADPAPRNPSDEPSGWTRH